MRVPHAPSWLSAYKVRRPFLKEALRGQMGPHQRYMLSSYLRVLDAITLALEELVREVATRMGPNAEAIERLDPVPGVGRRSAEEILAETGTDMSRFPSTAHLASWAKQGLATTRARASG
jgi:transposase